MRDERTTKKRGVEIKLCPQCQKLTSCQQRESYAWVHCNGVPFTSRGKRVDFNQCLSCKCRFPLSIDFEHLDSTQALEYTLLTVLIATAHRWNTQSGEFEKTDSRKVYGHLRNLLPDSELTESSVLMRYKYMKHMSMSMLDENLYPSVLHLSEDQKYTVLNAIASLAMTMPPKPGMIQEEEKMTLELAHHLGISPVRGQPLITEATNSTRTRIQPSQADTPASRPQSPFSPQKMMTLFSSATLLGTQQSETTNSTQTRIQPPQSQSDTPPSRPQSALVPHSILPLFRSQIQTKPKPPQNESPPTKCHPSPQQQQSALFPHNISTLFSSVNLGGESRPTKNQPIQPPLRPMLPLFNSTTPGQRQQQPPPRPQQKMHSLFNSMTPAGQKQQQQPPTRPQQKMLTLFNSMTPGHQPPQRPKATLKQRN